MRGACSRWLVVVVVVALARYPSYPPPPLIPPPSPLSSRLLDDYGLYSYPDWYEQLCKEFGCPRDFVVKKDLEKVASARS